MRRLRLPRRPSFSTLLLVFPVMLVASNLRAAVAAVGPLLHRIQDGEGLSNAGASALTTVPVLCYGLVALAAPLLVRRLGLRAAVTVALAFLMAGQLLRLFTGVAFLFVGTAIAGSAIAIGNVLMPVVIRRDFPDGTGVAMSVFSTTLMAFAAVAAGVSVPVADALGGGWRPGLAIWAVPAGFAMLVWLPGSRRSRPRVAAAVSRPAGVRPAPSELRTILRKPLAWQVTLFFALQSGGFYATLAWLPSIFQSHGYSAAQAGVLLSVNLVVGTLTGLVIPRLAHRMSDQRALVVSSCLIAAVGWMGILAAPSTLAFLWVAVLGLGQNASFPLVMMLIVLRGGNVRTTQALSAMAQSVGYVLAAFAPLAVGAVHGLTHSWTPEVILLLLLLLPQLLVGLGAAQRRELSSRDPAASMDAIAPEVP